MKGGGAGKAKAAAADGAGAAMHPEFSSSVSHPSSDQDFEFAFNSSNFSDRVLRIEIAPDPPEARAAAEARSGAGGAVEWRGSKRRKEELEKGKAVEIAVCDVDGNHPDFEDDVVDESHDSEAIAMIEESPSGSDTPVLRVKSIYISSAILAAKSPFFYKLFSNGMRESDQRYATLRINESEEAALMDLLSYMYSKKLSSNTAPALLDVLMAADKFEVASCMRHCSELLCNIPMTPDSALLYLDLPCSVSMASAVQPLTNAAQKYLATRYKDITKFHDEVLLLPVAGIEAILCSDELQVPSEDSVYDFLLKWARLQYPKLEDRREVLGSLLSRVIRFPFVTCRKLKKVLACNDVDHDVASKLVLEALFFKAEAAHRQRAIASEESSSRRFVERSYKYRPVKVVEFELPYQQCIVFLDLKREECANLFPAGRVYSQAFHLGGQGFFLSAHCNMDQQSSFHCFGLFLGMQEKGVVSLTVDYEFAARTSLTGEFASKYKGYYTFAGGKAVGYRNLFGIPWISFMADDSPYFINGTLHLRAELTIKQDVATTSKVVS